MDAPNEPTGAELFESVVRQYFPSLIEYLPTPKLDPKPWFCVSCSDRFAKMRTSYNHTIEFHPRADRGYSTDPAAYELPENEINHG